MKSLYGRLEVISGPMFSGKTESLIARLREREKAGEKVLAARPAIDTRLVPGLLMSHNGTSYPAVVVGGDEGLSRFVDGADVLGIDEAQFFSKELAAALKPLMAQSINLIVAGLDLDYRGRPFESLRGLTRLADSWSRLVAVCELCGRTATHTQRVIDGLPAPLEDTTVRIGSHELYEARCASCHASEEALRPQFAHRQPG